MYIVIWRNLFEPNSLKFSVTFVISSTFIKHIHPALRLLKRMSAATAQSIETKSRQAYPVFLSSNTKKALIKKILKKHTHLRSILRKRFQRIVFRWAPEFFLSFTHFFTWLWMQRMEVQRSLFLFILLYVNRKTFGAVSQQCTQLYQKLFYSVMGKRNVYLVLQLQWEGSRTWVQGTVTVPLV
jgi:hypothetical protein